MGGLSLQRRLSASLLKVGVNRVWIDDEHMEEVKNAITRADIKKMISHGYIGTRPYKIKYPEKKKKKKQNPGSRKGRKGARLNKKRAWINTVRPLRAMLKDLREQKKIDTAVYKKTYMLIKGGNFRSRAHLKLYLEQRGIKL